MSALDPKYTGGDWCRLRTLQQVSGEARSRMGRNPQDDSGLRLIAAWCRVQIDRIDPDQSKRRELRAAIKGGQ